MLQYPDDYINHVICGDCLEVMKGIPDGVVDLVLTDPPYGMNYSGRGDVEPFVGFDNDDLDEDEYIDWCKQWLVECYRVLKDDTAFYSWIDYRHYMYLYQAVKDCFTIKNCIVWDKISFGMGKHYRFQHEFCIYAQKGNPLLNVAGRVSDIWHIRRDSKIKYNHPTQKPINLMGRCIKDSSTLNSIILDPFLGSGTTAVAAQKLGRRFIGIEIDPKYCEIARKRLEFGKQLF